jgi:hypothetical protein
MLHCLNPGFLKFHDTTPASPEVAHKFTPTPIPQLRQSAKILVLHVVAGLYGVVRQQQKRTALQPLYTCTYSRLRDANAHSRKCAPDNCRLLPHFLKRPCLILSTCQDCAWI